MRHILHPLSKCDSILWFKNHFVFICMANFEREGRKGMEVQTKLHLFLVVCEE